MLKSLIYSADIESDLFDGVSMDSHLSGMSLIEVVLALALGGLGLILVSHQLSDIKKLREVSSDFSIISSLEENMRLALSQKGSLERLIKKSPNLEACFQRDQKSCNLGPIPIPVFSSSGKRATGSFNLRGERCDDSGCPLRVQAYYVAFCTPAETFCDQAESLVIRYEIYMTDTSAPIRSGNHHIYVSQSNFSDDVMVCGSDELDRVKLANKLNRNSVSCIEVPVPSRTLSGIVAGECDRDLEILSGFDAAGNPVCKKLDFYP